MNLGFVRKRLKNLYSSTGRPSIDPEVLLRLLLVGYFYGITSERRLFEEARMHLVWRQHHGTCENNVCRTAATSFQAILPEHRRRFAG